MTDLERELALKITTGQTVGAGIFMNVAFKPTKRV